MYWTITYQLFGCNNEDKVEQSSIAGFFSPEETPIKFQDRDEQTLNKILLSEELAASEGKLIHRILFTVPQTLPSLHSTLMQIQLFCVGSPACI